MSCARMVGDGAGLLGPGTGLGGGWSVPTLGRPVLNGSGEAVGVWGLLLKKRLVFVCLCVCVVKSI